MKKVVDYDLKVYPSILDVVYYGAAYEFRLHQNFDLGLLGMSKVTIKDIQKDILEYLSCESDFSISKKMAYKIAQNVYFYAH